MIMDFNMKKGDKFCFMDEVYSTITDTGKTTINGVERRYWIVNGESKWVEGIGCENQFAWLTPFLSHCGIYDYMEACYDNGELVFSKSDFDNISTGVNSMEADRNASGSGKAYGLSGERIDETGYDGIYIKNGRKYATQGHH